MRMTMASGTLRLVTLILFLSGMVSCASMSRTTKGTILGGAAGGVVGGVIGKQVGSTAKGAIIGAVIGGAAGAYIGHRMDKQAEELSRNIPGATVQRVGEGIVVTFESGLMFAFDSDEIRGATRANLDELARSLNEYSDSDLLIVGHTDDVGGDTYNQNLSERRAKSAMRYLVSSGVRSLRIDTRGMGESEPIASNARESGRQENRSIEVAIYAGQEMRERARREASG